MATQAQPANLHFTIGEAIKRIPAQGIRSVPVFEHGTLLLKLYTPRGVDPQPPHTRDEVYVVARGQGMFVNGDRRHAFAAGDVLFVPAGVTHRFEEFSDDLTVWVVFYGPEGGEAGQR